MNMMKGMKISLRGIDWTSNYSTHVVSQLSAYWTRY